MMTIRTGQDLGVDICAAVGLDPSNVQALTIHLSTDDVARVTAQIINFDADGLTTAFKHYELVEREPTVD